MSKFSEKRTYILNGEMIFVTKCSRDPKIENLYHVTYENLVTKEIKKVPSTELVDAVKTVDSTEFFTMWMHFNNWKRQDLDHEYVVDHCKNVLKWLIDRKIEMHGSNKFELYDIKHIIEMYNYAWDYEEYDFYSGDLSSNLSIVHRIDQYDNGYYYNFKLTELERFRYDSAVELSKVLKKEITDELDREIIKQMLINSEDQTNE